MPTNTKVLERFDTLNRFFLSSSEPQVIKITEVTETMAYLNDGCVVKRTPDAHGNYELKYYGEGRCEERVYCARQEPVWTPEQREQVEGLVFKRMHNDFKGVREDGVRCILTLLDGGTCSVPLSTLSNMDLYDRLPMFPGFYVPRP